MDTKRLKTVVIIILACVNLTFGGILVFDGLSGAGAAAKERGELAEVLHSRGIDIAADAIPEAGSVTVCSMERDISGEQALAAALLGTVRGQAQGGNIYYYENDRGSIRFRAGGSFEAVLYDCTLTDAELAEVFGAHRAGGGYAFRCGGREIFNCAIDIKRTGGALTVTGTRPVGTPYPGEEKPGRSMGTVLLRFVDEINGEGIVCTRISSLTPGYLMSVTAASAELDPVWRVETDAGTYFVYAESGKPVL